tara:strand:- start:202 stop:603 length:402 start_codon:yes stop_codon:yes gene_type:complete
MEVETIFKKTVVFKTVMFILIILWGGSVQSSNLTSNNVTDIGGLLFFLFSILYIFTAYLLYSFKYLGMLLFFPNVIAFFILGFLMELNNPFQFSKDLFYLIIFYIVSPIFFVGQGVVLSLLYLTDIKDKFRAD